MLPRLDSPIVIFSSPDEQSYASSSSVLYYISTQSGDSLALIFLVPSEFLTHPDFTLASSPTCELLSSPLWQRRVFTFLGPRTKPYAMRVDYDLYIIRQRKIRVQGKGSTKGRYM
jgi:hypothetical protein